VQRFYVWRIINSIRGELKISFNGLNNLVMGPGQTFLTRVGSGQPFMVWVWIWKISPNNVKFFNFLSFGSGRKVPWLEAGWPLFYCGSKVSSGRVGSWPISNIITLTHCYYDFISKLCRVFWLRSQKSWIVSKSSLEKSYH